MYGTNRITLRASGDADEEFLRGLYASTRQAEMAQLPWAAEAKQSLLRMQFEAQRDHYRSLYPKADHSMVLAAERLVGRLYVYRQHNQILIVDISLLPEFQRRGIGRALLSDLQAEAASLGKALTAHVGRWNQASRSFFERVGFDVTDEDELSFRASWAGAAATVLGTTGAD